MFGLHSFIHSFIHIFKRDDSKSNKYFFISSAASVRACACVCVCLRMRTRVGVGLHGGYNSLALVALLRSGN